MSDIPISGDKNQAEFIFDLVKRRYDAEMDNKNKLDEQARGVIGSSLVVVGFLLGAGTISMVDLRLPFLLILYFLGIAFLVTAVTIDLVSLRFRRVVIVPDIKVIGKKYRGIPYLEAIKENCIEMAEATASNEKINSQKQNLIMIAWFFLIVGLVAVLIFVTGAILSGTDLSVTP